jgi:hypothetical protein
MISHKRAPHRLVPERKEESVLVVKKKMMGTLGLSLVAYNIIK